MTTTTLEELAVVDTDEVFNLKPPINLTVTLLEPPTPSVTNNLAKLAKLGLLNGDVLMALIGQAPIDPINLMATLLAGQPTGWAFSAIDFTMVRVLSQTANKAVASALRVDLMGGTLSTLVLNQANQLTIYKTLEVEPSDTMNEQINALCVDAVVAAKREARNKDK